MIKTDICDLLQIEYPIFQGGMAWVANADLAAAVSNAGGLGIIAAMSSNGQQLKEEIRKTREKTNKPFGVNIMLMSPHTEEVARTVIEEKVEVVTTGAGNPGKYIPGWKDAGIKVIPVVPSTGFAKLVASRGASAVIAEGCEAGGHIGELTTMTLVPQVADSVDIPVIAAGGIADGRAMAAALMLGAYGVQVGTRFLVARECGIHPEYKKKVLKARDIDTVVTGRKLGHPVRSLKNPFSREFESAEKEGDFSLEDLEKMGAGALRTAVLEGDLKKGCFMAGQCASLVKCEQTAAEIIKEMTFEAEKVISEACKWVK